MKKHLIVSGLVFILLMVGFSGCSESYSIEGIWYQYLSGSHFYNIYKSDNTQIFKWYDSDGELIRTETSTYSYNNNIIIKRYENGDETIIDFEWIDSNTIILTYRGSGKSHTEYRVDSIPYE